MTPTEKAQIDKWNELDKAIADAKAEQKAKSLAATQDQSNRLYLDVVDAKDELRNEAPAMLAFINEQQKEIEQRRMLGQLSTEALRTALAKLAAKDKLLAMARDGLQRIIKHCITPENHWLGKECQKNACIQVEAQETLTALGEEV